MFRLTVRMLMLMAMLSVVEAHAAQAPDFSVPSDRGSISLKGQRGSIVYLDFWASWCVPCRKSFPWLNDMQARYGKAGLKIIAINLDEDKKLAERFLQKIPARFTIGYDPKGKFASAYGLKGMPSSYLIDREGGLLSSHVGFRSNDKAELEKRIRQALKK